MTDHKRTALLLKIFLAALVATIIVVVVVFREGRKSDTLKVSFLDIGQGDAIYIEAPNGKQMIIDGGPGTALLGVLPRVMPAGDRSVDVILNTNPDTDHYSGFISLLERYKIGAVVDPMTTNDNDVRDTYEAAVTAEGVPHVGAYKGMKIVLDPAHNIYYEVLFPDRDVRNWSSNDGSIVGRLVYGETSFMLMGDATARTEGIVRVNTDPAVLDVDVLKLGHHGSKTSSSEAWLLATTPEHTIISAGCDNRYGHPHPEVVARLDMLSIQHFGTCEKGTITFESNGIAVATKFEKSSN